MEAFWKQQSGGGWGESQTSHLSILSSIGGDISQDKTVIKRQRNTDLSFRSDSSIAVPSPGGVRRHMSAVIDSSQRCQLAAGKLQGKIRTSISVVPNGRLGSREGPLQTWWYQYLVGLVHFSCNSNHQLTFQPYLNPTVHFDWSLSAVIKYKIWQNTAKVNEGRSLFIKSVIIQL